MKRPLPTITLLLAASLCTFAARAETVATVSSPNKVLTVELDLHEGRLAYRVLRFGEKVIDDSRLGFRLRGSGALDRNLALASQARRSHDRTWEQPWGENRFVRDHHEELRATLRETIEPNRRFDLVFRVFDDGIGFRYEFPEQPALAEAIVDDELTEFVLAEPATAWWIPAGEWNRYEYLYQRTPVEQVTTAHTPMTVRTDDGLHIAFHEAALVDYAGMWLRRAEGRRFRAQLSPASEGWKVRRTLPFHTPWRTIQVADTAAALYASSDLILNLNEPSRLGDVSWFEPAKYVGIWWSLHLETESWATGPKHGATTANTKRYIDFAAKHGFRGVLVEGWNPGWDGQWFGNELRKRGLGEVRGAGMMWGIELDRPASPVARELLDHGFVVGTAREKILRLLPPYNVPKKALIEFMDALALVLNATADDTRRQGAAKEEKAA